MRYLVRRLIQMIPTVLFVVILEFVLVQLAPGNVAHILAGENPSPEYIAALVHQYGLDKPLGTQLLAYLANVVQGKFGLSYVYQRPVIDVVGERVVATLVLVVTSLVLASVAGTLLGAMMSASSRQWFKSGLNAVAVVTYSVPVFIIGLVLILVFGMTLKVFPVSGISSGEDAGFLDYCRHLVLPVITLGSFFFGQYVRLAHSSMSGVLGSDYISAARAMGFPRRTWVYRYGLRNASLPLISLFAVQIGLALSGAVLTEAVFSWPGIGSLVFQAILQRDIPMVVGVFTLVSVAVIVLSFLADVVYTLLDPRVRLGSKG